MHPHWGGFIALLISATESIAIIGTIVPGSVMMTAIGTLIGTGVLPATSTIIWAIAGAIIGDGLSYWLGYALKDRIRTIWPFRRYPKILETGEHYFRRHGAKSVFFGRFVGPVRAIVPMIAGMIGLKPLKFYAANILSAMAWAPAYMIPGYLIGSASLQLPPNVAIHLILSLLATLICVIFLTWLIRLLILRVSNRIHTQLDKLWLHLQNHKHENFLTVWFKSTDKNHLHGQLGSALGLLLFGTLFVLLLINVCIGDTGIVGLNNPLYYFFRGLRAHGIDQIFVCITFFGQASVLMPTMLMLAIVLYIKKHKRTAWHCAGLTFFTSLLLYLIKWAVHYPRPGGILQAPLTYSFPSGHTTLSVACYSFIAMLLLKSMKNTASRKMVYYFYAVIILLISFSRLYLGAHWLTDVLGGLLLGVCAFLLTKVLYYREETPTVSPKIIGLSVLLSLAVFWSIYFIRNFKKQMYDFQRVWPTIQIDQTQWWQKNGDQTVLYRNDRFGYPKEALNMQWAAQPNVIKTLLVNDHWLTIQKFYWSDFLHPTQLAKRISILPILPKLFRNSSPGFIFVKRLANKQVVVLRLWNTHIQLIPQKTPLWVGLLSYQQTYENEKPLPTPKASPLLGFTKEINGSQWKLATYPIKKTKGGNVTLPEKLLLINSENPHD